MLYGKLHSIIEECGDLLCEAMNKKGITDKNVCAKIIETFSTTEEHMAVDDFASLLAKKGVRLDEELVATALAILSDFGFARELQFEGEGVKRYEHLHPFAHHDHFVCIKCKKIIEFENKQLERMQESLIFQKGCRPLFHKLEVYGICDRCTYAKRKPFPITFAKEETVVKLHKIEKGWHLKKRLTDLGFVENEPITIIKNSHFGPIVLEVKESRFALGRGQAQKILVYEQ